MGADLDSENEWNDEEAKAAQEISYSEHLKSHQEMSEHVKEVGWFKRSLFWICGIENSLKTIEVEEAIEAGEVDTSIDQDPKWAMICNINAVLAIALSGFCVAFFNKYD